MSVKFQTNGSKYVLQKTVQTGVSYGLLCISGRNQWPLF